jgi:AraC-like DNA-binding protein
VFSQSTVYLFSAWLFLILALGQLLIRNKTDDQYFSAVFYFSLGLWIVVAGTIWDSSYLPDLHLSLTFIRAPLFYFYFCIIIDPEFRFSKKSFFHLLPGIVVFFALLNISFAGVNLNVSVLDVLTGTSGHPSAALFSILLFISLCLPLTYLVYIIYRYRLLFFGSVTNFSTKVVFFQVAYSILAIGTASAEQFFYGRMQPASMWMASLVPIIFLLSMMRYPEYIRLIKIETEKTRYALSRIQGLDLDCIFQNMHRLMEEDHIFTDEGLTLPRLSEKLSISPQQLSEILNAKLNKSFYEYVNEFRINEAKRLLTEQPDDKISYIAQKSGFNSQSSFYNAFNKATGESPGSYRKKGLPGKTENPARNN